MLLFVRHDENQCTDFTNNEKGLREETEQKEKNTQGILHINSHRDHI